MSTSPKSASITDTEEDEMPPSNIPWYTFTDDDKHDLEHSWKIIEPKKNQIACDIYEMIFNQCPEVRRLFPKLKFVNSKPDRKSNEFTFQAMRFMQVIEGAVRALDNLPSLDIILDNLGRRHGKLEVNGKFRSYYWSTFLECCIFNIRLNLSKKMNSLEVDRIIILWRCLLRDVMKKIKAGTTADIAQRMLQMSIEESRMFSLPAIHKESNASSADVSFSFETVDLKNGRVLVEFIGD
ncbi:unnamed protein product [Caenorhabditis bovis]|uniref:Globin domain-containing protein n=1 Tax=Caenorhabditis bovis TaxID=2654633 RepID=A0A8S1ET05_9PELO|nr:unnamed protein product [Caenorhabditis bovis]